MRWTQQAFISQFYWLQKAFDTVGEQSMLQDFTECQIDYRYTNLISDIYQTHKAYVKHAKNTADVSMQGEFDKMEVNIDIWPSRWKK